MEEKVILILVDGMRPDAIIKCGHRFLPEMIKKGASSLKTKTVMPSITLPCHMSLFHSVDPSRHGILSNLYAPQVRPVKGLCEQLRTAGKKSAFFYNWEELRDLSRPGSLAYSCFLSLHQYEDTDRKIANAAIQFIQENLPDFVFIYLGETDETGHKYGWMTDEYLSAVNNASGCIEQIFDAFSGDYTIMVTADHGGHDRSHGTEIPEDMLIPLIISGKRFEAQELPETVSILDIAPTVAALLGVQTDPDWEGKSLI